MFIAAPEDSADTARLYQSCQDAQGFVMNLYRAWAWRPDICEGFAALRNQLVAGSTLSKRDQAVLTCAMASELGDAYCALAWGRLLAKEAGAAEAAALIRDEATGAAEALTERDRALAAWARRLVADPNASTAADVQALRQLGLGDREIFELTVFVAFRLAFSTVNDALGALPDAQLLAQAPPELRAAVDFGRA